MEEPKTHGKKTVDFPENGQKQRKEAHENNFKFVVEKLLEGLKIEF